MEEVDFDHVNTHKKRYQFSKLLAEENKIKKLTALHLRENYKMKIALTGVETITGYKFFSAK